LDVVGKRLTVRIKEAISGAKNPSDSVKKIVDPLMVISFAQMRTSIKDLCRIIVAFRAGTWLTFD